jgi:hypothetical protein
MTAKAVCRRHAQQHVEGDAVLMSLDHHRSPRVVAAV